jgi:hypothetical protein
MVVSSSTWTVKNTVNSTTLWLVVDCGSIESTYSTLNNAPNIDPGKYGKASTITPLNNGNGDRIHYSHTKYFIGAMRKVFVF